jgi:pseudouridine synthase
MGYLRGVREYVYPVGRLDYDSEGLVLLTNDGTLAARVTHPRHGVVKRYRAQVLGIPSPEALATLARGVVIDGHKTGRADVRMVKVYPGGAKEHAVLEVGIHEGRNRQVRRMCEAIGHPVTRLERVAIGPIADRTLKAGQWRELTTRELDALRPAAGGHAFHCADGQPWVSTEGRRSPRVLKRARHLLGRVQAGSRKPQAAGQSLPTPSTCASRSARAPTLRGPLADGPPPRA